MTDEEKKAIEEIKDRVNITKNAFHKLGIAGQVNMNVMLNDIEYLLTAYEKEKEKNKKLDKENQDLFELYNFNDSSLLAKILKDYKKIIEKRSKEIEELKDESKEYQIGFAQGCYEKDLDWKDKINAKVIEIKNRPVKDEFITATQGKLNTIIDIESLLD